MAKKPNDQKRVQIKRGFFCPLTYETALSSLRAITNSLYIMIPFTVVLASNLFFLQLLLKIFKRKQMMLVAFCIENEAADYSERAVYVLLPTSNFLLSTQSYLKYLL